MIPANVSGNIPSGVVLKRRYKILRKIAQGGMGAVYESTDLTDPLGHRWAVKEMSPASLPTNERSQAIADFRREAQMLHTVKHPNLPLVVETFEEMGKHFLVMEFIAGHTLLNIVDNTVGYLPEERVMVWARQLFDVLHYLHTQNPPIIYRDVKPANVMLMESTERIKLIDFGIARFHKQGKAQDTEAFGTAGYAPPEQYGKGQTDQRSDVYALAATLHHLVTKHDPSLNPFNWLPARRLNPGVSPALENALMVATSLDPAKRFQSIAEFGRAVGILLPDGMAARPIIVEPRPVESTIKSANAPTLPAPKARGNSRKKSTAQPLKPTTGTQAPMPVAAALPARPAPVMPAVAAAAAAAIPAAASVATQAAEIKVPKKTGVVAEPVQAPAPAPVSVTPKKQEKKQQQAPINPPGPLSAPSLVVSEPVLDLGESRWNTRLARRVNLTSPTGAMRGMVVATQPWISYNPQHFQGNAVTLEVKVKKGQLRFGRVELQVPNLFAIIWARTRRLLPFIGCWFWLLLLVASSLGRTLLMGLAAVVGALLVFEGLMWLWAQHVKVFVPAAKLNTGRIMVKSSGGDQHIDVRVLARPSWLQRSTGWTVALLLFVVEISVVTWFILIAAGVSVSVPGLW
jgi:serine/threonine protein kinase